MLSGELGRGDAWRRPGKVLRLLMRPGIRLVQPGVPLVRLVRSARPALSPALTCQA